MIVKNHAISVSFYERFSWVHCALIQSQQDLRLGKVIAHFFFHKFSTAFLRKKKANCLTGKVGDIYMKH